METPAEIVAEIRRDIQDMKAHNGGITNTASTVFNLGGAGLVFGLCFGSICLGVAIGLYFKMEARELVMAAERRADMAALTAVQSDANFAKSQASAAKTLANEVDKDLGQRIAKLEARK